MQMVIFLASFDISHGYVETSWNGHAVFSMMIQGCFFFPFLLHYPSFHCFLKNKVHVVQGRSPSLPDWTRRWSPSDKSRTSRTPSVTTLGCRGGRVQLGIPGQWKHMGAAVTSGCWCSSAAVIFPSAKSLSRVAALVPTFITLLLG